MKNWIRSWLGITDLPTTRELDVVRQDIMMELAKLRNELVVTFHSDELDPKRRAMSDQIGERVKAKLLAEENARRHTEGRPLLDHLP